MEHAGSVTDPYFLLLVHEEVFGWWVNLRPTALWKKQLVTDLYPGRDVDGVGGGPGRGQGSPTRNKQFVWEKELVLSVLRSRPYTLLLYQYKQFQSPTYQLVVL